MYERYLELLNSTGVKSSDVAKATGIPPSTFSDWKRGKSSPKYEKLQKIANYFGVKADWLQGTSLNQSNIFQMENYPQKQENPVKSI